MAIEIKELIIRARVEPEADGTAPSRGATPPGGQGGTADTEKIVSECVTQVLEILRRERER